MREGASAVFDVLSPEACRAGCAHSLALGPSTGPAGDVTTSFYNYLSRFCLRRKLLPAPLRGAILYLCGE
jgi:hypothetical protein